MSCFVQFDGLGEFATLDLYWTTPLWSAFEATAKIVLPSGDHDGRTTLSDGSPMHAPAGSVVGRTRTKQRSASPVVAFLREYAITVPSGENAGRRSLGPAVWGCAASGPRSPPIQLLLPFSVGPRRWAPSAPPGCQDGSFSISLDAASRFTSPPLMPLMTRMSFPSL